ncbi:2-hydroxyisoflavanone dehydratase-like [Euphorbia lathyris]|uniref:2-hydroxyisoflavanone dehydratase-like n=1 Tax=Euphorbia lathyris TaxID=212925 RepID=UPI0033130D18
MASEITHDFPGFFKVLKDGRIERYLNSDFVPPGIDEETGIQTKDVVVSSSGVKARIFLPKIDDPSKKLPLVIHYHGGGFCIGSALSASFKTFLSALSSQANVVAISVEYRLAPENLLPIAYDDCYAALQWIAGHSGGGGPEPWLNQHADLNRVILAGESAGANLAHYVGVQAGAKSLTGVNISKLLIIHPFFGSNDPDPIYIYMYPSSPGNNDEPKLNPGVDPELKKLKCEKIMVCLAEKDFLKSRGVFYCEIMRKNGWDEKLELYETKGEEHCFYLFNPRSPNLAPLIKTMVDFIKFD